MPQFNVTLDRGLIDALHGKAEREGLSLSELARRMLYAGLDRPVPDSPLGKLAEVEDGLGDLRDWIEQVDRRLGAIEEIARR